MCCRAFAPLMIERGGGRIVNVASGSAYLPPRDGPNSTAYPASKAAVHRFSEVLAASLAPQNVFVFSISPGLVRTSMTALAPATTRRGRRPNARRGSCTRSRRGSSTSSPAATSTPSTIRPSSCASGWMRSSRDDLNAIRLRR